MAKIPKYRENVKIQMYFDMFDFNNGKIRLRIGFAKFRENFMKIKQYQKMTNLAQNINETFLKIEKIAKN